MNKIIEEQLSNVKRASIIKSSDNKYVLKKIEKDVYFEGEYYIIKLNSILLSKTSLPILVNNWNNGTVPTNTYYRCEVLTTLNDFIKISGVGLTDNLEDTSSYWEGWLPINNISLVSKL